jgi:UDP-glucose 4-epimerase
MSKLMITGANGFLGRNAVEPLRQMFDETVLVDRPHHDWDPNQSARSSWVHNNEVYHAVVGEDQSFVSKLLKDVDTVVHFGNTSRIDPSWAYYGEYYNNNITNTQRFFQLCQQMGVKKFIHISSSSVYGNNGKQVQKETDPTMPTNPYAVSKLAGEWALYVQSQRSDTELIIVRPFTMYGKFMDYGVNALVVAKFINAWERNEPLVLHGSGEQRRDFLHVSDAIQGLKLIIEHGEHGDVFNLGTGKSVSIKQLADCVSSKQILGPDREGAISVTHADITRLRNIGYEPTVNVLEWLTNHIEELKLKSNNNLKESVC